MHEKYVQITSGVNGLCWTRLMHCCSSAMRGYHINCDSLDYVRYSASNTTSYVLQNLRVVTFSMVWILQIDQKRLSRSVCFCLCACTYFQLHEWNLKITCSVKEVLLKSCTFHHLPQSCTVLAVSNGVEHESTSYAVLKYVEVEFWCGTCRCDTGTQCWGHRVNIKAAHFGARMLKRKTIRGGGGMPNRTEIWHFQGVNVEETAWNFHGRIWTQGDSFPRTSSASTQKPHVRVKRLLGLVKQQKESNRVTIWRVDKANPHWHRDILIKILLSPAWQIRHW